ncbi:MAG: translation initiation factor IF-2 [Bacilli bacterium]|nr:translation initiation factor IF-2 [Bacilli bacterium]MBR3362744.1 translation initiation factor IF-2 [Bacilli bacterium]
MSVLEYAEDINTKVEIVLSKCKELGIDVSSETDLLDEDAIILLDNSIEPDEEIEETYEEEIKPKKEQKKQPKKQVAKKPKPKETNKKDLAKEKKAMYKNKEKLQSNAQDKNIIVYKENMTIGNLADALEIKASEIIKKLFSLGLMVNINSPITYENAELLVSDYNKTLKKEDAADISNFEEYEVIDDDKDLVSRPPVVTIMGHVDHGKTTLLDAIRRTDVVSTEAGGITQAISAYQVRCNDRLITFIDTPGHAAFTEMRARGASITDIVIIIVAADDGVMPQTKEAIDHAKAAKVPILVAINKIDKPDANPDKVMQELGEYGLMPEQWGGNTIFTNISAKTGEGIEELLENILLVSDMEELKANPNRYAIGTVVESRLNKQVGSIVTVLVQNGTLRLGDPVVVGTAYGKIRTLKNDKGEEITQALPSQPVEITGLNDVPSAGDKFMSFENEKEARSIAEERKNKARLREINKKTAVSLDDLFSKIGEGMKEINVIIKADVNGSAEAVKNSLEKIDVEGVKVNVIRSTVGGITESDIVLAGASNAIIIGFNVRPSNQIKDKANELGIDIRLYDIIYKVVEEMEAAMKGMLDPEFEEKILGNAEIRQIFKFSKVGNIAGSFVVEGTISRNNKARIIRDGVVIYDGQIGSLQRGKDSVKEVKKGLECGITIENFNDIKQGDIIEAYEMVEIER